MSELEKLPKDKHSYGMIHNDLHQGNFYLHDQKMVLFDFGDCEYNWFVYDIAIVLYHALETVGKNNLQGRKDFALLFMRAFLKGYKTENQLDSDLLHKLPFFLNYRQIFSYMYFSKFLNKEQKNTEKVKKILHDMKIKIENGIPYIDFQLKKIL